MSSFEVTSAGNLESPPQFRWSLARKHPVVVRLLRGESLRDDSQEIGVPVHKLALWKRKALAAGLQYVDDDTWLSQHHEVLDRLCDLSAENHVLRQTIEFLRRRLEEVHRRQCSPKDRRNLASISQPA